MVSDEAAVEPIPDVDGTDVYTSEGYRLGEAVDVVVDLDAERATGVCVRDIPTDTFADVETGDRGIVVPFRYVRAVDDAIVLRISVPRGAEGDEAPSKSETDSAPERATEGSEDAATRTNSDAGAAVGPGDETTVARPEGGVDATGRGVDPSPRERREPRKDPDGGGAFGSSSDDASSMTSSDATGGDWSVSGVGGSTSGTDGDRTASGDGTGDPSSDTPSHEAADEDGVTWGDGGAPTVDDDGTWDESDATGGSSWGTGGDTTDDGDDGWTS